MRKATPVEAALPSKPLRVLMVDNDPTDAELCLRELKRAGMEVEVETVGTREEYALKLREGPFDVILADYRMTGWTGLDAFSMQKELGLDRPTVLVTGTLGEELAVECLRRGISDYVLKHQLARLPVAIRHAVEEKALREQQLQAERALRESEASFRLMFAANPLPMWVFDVETLEFLQVNDAAVMHYGYSHTEFLEMKFAQIHSEEESQRLQEYLRSRDRLARSAGMWRHRTKGGREIDVEIMCHPFDFAGRPGMLVVAQDATERNLAVEALRKSELRYRSLVENSPYGIYRITPAGGLLDLNPALVAMLGYESADELLAVDWQKDVYRNPGDRLRLIEQARATGRTDAEVDWKRKDGGFITVRIGGRLLRDEREGAEHCEFLAEDVTEKRVLAKQLQQAQKFEAIGQLAGGIAHDFNNMIGAILGWAEMGLEETEAGSRLHRYFDKVRLQGARAAALTKQLLAFARRQILEPRDMDLNQTVVDTLSLLEKVIGSNIEISATLAPDLAVVRADPTQIEQVLMNLCLNSRDAMPNGGQLAIETKDAQINEEYCRLHAHAHPGRFVMLSVSDTGTGMDAATLDRIFEPFFTTKEMGKGTGLGLATVYGIVKQHGGFVYVYSEPGQGTSFRAYLPISSSVVIAATEAVDTGPMRGGDETILVAEDHEGLREIARETLTHLGYNVMMAQDGEQAVEEFRTHRDRINLVLLDVILPKMSGPDAYARMSGEKPGVPAIFATGYSAEMARLGQMEAKGVPVLQKPYTPRELARKVRETLDRAARA
jgi:two-component system, cell cycle sensor histidine kinase and response regulator CckA